MMGMTAVSRLADPELLAVIVLLPFVCGWRPRLQALAAVPFSSVDLLGFQGRTLRQRVAHWLPVSRALAFTLLVLALARPQVGAEPVRVTSEGADIVLVLDRSSSMSHDDLGEPKARFEMAREVLAAFASRRPDDRLALVMFARCAELVCPLTSDHRAVIEMLRRARLVQLDNDADGTAIGAALALVGRTLQDSESATKLAILLTDGENNENAITPEEGSLWCRHAGIRVHVAAVGRERVSEQGTRLETPLDLESLKLIPEITGGRLYHAGDALALEQIYSTIDALEKTRLEDRIIYTRAEEVAMPLLGVSLVIFILEMLARFGFARRLP
ncbi:MAG: VWA domain-containing protein [Planctomycetota bacterium]